MKKIDINNEEEVILNGAVYRPICGECTYDGRGPFLTVKFLYVRDLPKFPSTSKRIEIENDVDYRLALLEARLDRFIDRYFEESS